ADERGDLLLRDAQRDRLQRLRRPVPEREVLHREDRSRDLGIRRGDGVRLLGAPDLPLLPARRRLKRLHGALAHTPPVETLRLRWFRRVMAARLTAVTTAMSSNAVANTSGFVASTFGDWKPTS